MSTRSPILEEALKRIRTGTHSAGSSKRRRTSKLLLVIDAVLIVIILLFFYNKEPETMYKTASFNYKDISVRTSLTRDKQNGDYLFSLSMTSRADRDISLPFVHSVGAVNLYCNDQLITKEPVAPNVTSLTFKSGENKTFARIISKEILSDFAYQNSKYIQPKKKSLIQLEKQHIPVTVEVILNSADPVAITMDFKHGVSL